MAFSANHMLGGHNVLRRYLFIVRITVRMLSLVTTYDAVAAIIAVALNRFNSIELLCAHRESRYVHSPFVCLCKFNVTSAPVGPLAPEQSR
jgi:hypothetical protein